MPGYRTATGPVFQVPGMRFCVRPLCSIGRVMDSNKPGTNFSPRSVMVSFWNKILDDIHLFFTPTFFTPLYNPTADSPMAIPDQIPWVTSPGDIIKIG